MGCYFQYAHLHIAIVQIPESCRRNIETLPGVVIINGGDINRFVVRFVSYSPALAAVRGVPGNVESAANMREGGKIAKLSEKSFDELNEFLPHNWSRSNPVDLQDDATADRFIKTVNIVSADSKNDGILVIVTPQIMTDPTASICQ